MRRVNLDGGDGVKKVIVSVLILAALLTSSLLISGCGTVKEYVVPYSDTSFQVSSLSQQTLTFNAGAGDTLEGYFTIRGGADEVDFWIEDPWGRTIYNAGRVYDRHDLHVTCANDGYYTLYFSNTFSLTVGKDIYLHYRVR